MKYDAVFNIAINILNWFGGNDSFSVLNYHRVMPNDDLISESALTPALFEQQLIWLKRHFTVLPLPTAFLLASQNALPKNTVVITIDDGFYDCYAYVFPLLLKHNMTATFFISTAGLNQGYLWENQISAAICHAPAQLAEVQLEQQSYPIHDLLHKRQSIAQLTEHIKYKTLAQRQQLLAELMQQCADSPNTHQFMTPEQLQIMHAAGMTIGAHTVQHPILALEPLHIARAEISDSKTILEQITGAPIEFFAYPNGKYQVDFNDEHISLVQELGFKAAFSTDWGVATLSNDSLFKLKRFTPWDRSPGKFCLRLALNSLADRYHFSFFRNKVRQHVA